MKLLTILALLIATCAIFLGVGQSEETVKIDDVKETPIKTDLTDAEKEKKQPDSFESDKANNDEDEEEGKGDDEEENRDEKDDENDETDSSSLSENEVNDLEETLPDTAALSKRSPWRGRRFVRRIKRKARRSVRRVTRRAKRFGGRVIRFGGRIIGAVRNVGDKLITNQVLDAVARKLKQMKRKMGKTCSLIKVSAGLEAKIPQLTWECEITEQKVGDEEYAGVQSDEAVGHKFREEVGENDLAKIHELIEAKEET